MTSSRAATWTALAGLGLLGVLPLWVNWCHAPESLDLNSLPYVAPFDPAGRSLVIGPGLPFGSDLVFASQSAHNFIAALHEGVIYPRWFDTSNRRLGGPTFFFYPPLPYYAVAAAALVTPDVVGAMRMVLALGALLATMTFFVAIREYVPRGIALAGAGLYILAPFHTLDLYDRFAFASYLAYAWYPLLFLFTNRLLRRPDRRAWFGLALSYGALVATHLVSGFLVLFVLAPYVMGRLAITRRWHRLIPVVLAGSLGLASVGVYIVPLLAHRSDVHLEWVVDAPYGNWRRNFVYRDEVAHGFKPAPIKPWVNRAATCQLLLGAIAAWMLVVNRGPRREIEAGASPRDDDLRLEGLLVGGLALWTFFLQIPLSTPIWVLTPELGTVQFPWRFGAFQGLATCFLLCHALAAWVRTPAGGQAAATVARSRQPAGRSGGRFVFGRPRPAGVALSVVTLATLALSGHAVLNRFFVFTESVAQKPVYLTRVMYEYIPQGVAGWRNMARLPSDLPAATLDGPGQVEIVRWTTHTRQLHLDIPAGRTVHVRTFDFPGWRARLDGSPAPIVPDETTHTITVRIPAGSHDLHLNLEATPDRVVGRAISLAALATMLGLGIAPAVRRRRRVPV
ncbi:MAG: 6-pyruvoyl-tetrahydropterin synthase-related protein [Acidobacteriota bacterium]